MKSLPIKLGIILIGLAIVGCAEVWGVDWKSYGVCNNYLGYYDVQTITRTSQNIVRVWVRLDLTEKGVMDMVGRFGKKYENLNQSKILYEINCVDKKVRELSSANYDNKGGLIYSFSSPSEWDFIVPDSMIEGLYEEVCK